MGYLGVALIAVAVLEIILSASWSDFYFRVGVPVFRKTFSYVGLTPTELRAEELSAQFEGKIAPSILFVRLSRCDIAFREKMLQWRVLNYTPLMHGIIRDDPVRQEITVTGHANWFAFAFLIWWYVSIFDFGLGRSELIFFAAPLLVYGLIYLIQYKRFSSVFRSVVARHSAGLPRETQGRPDAEC